MQMMNVSTGILEKKQQELLIGIIKRIPFMNKDQNVK